MIIGETYEMKDVTTASGHILNKGGQVKLVHIFTRLQTPSPDLVEKYYGYKDRKAKAFIQAAMPFKEDRYVFERVVPAGKPFILLTKYLTFVGVLGGAKRAETRIEYHSKEAVIDDISSGNVYVSASAGRYQIIAVKHNDAGERTHVILSFATDIAATGERVWVESSYPMDINAFAHGVVHSGALRVS